MSENATSVLLERFLDPVGRCLTPEVARRLVELRADAALQARVGELAEMNTEGRLSSEERSEYETYVGAVEFVSILQAKARALLAEVATS